MNGLEKTLRFETSFLIVIDIEVVALNTSTLNEARIKRACQLNGLQRSPLLLGRSVQLKPVR